MADNLANGLSPDQMAKGMEPQLGNNVKESYKPLIPGETIVTKEELSKKRWGNVFGETYTPQYFGKFYKGTAYSPSPETMQGENQPWTSKLGRGVTTNFVGIFTKAGTMLSEAGGGLFDLVTNIDPELAQERKDKYGTYFPHLFENFMTKGFKYVEEDLLEKNWLPVYGGQKYESGSLWTRMGDMKFWSSDVADGIAFAVAALMTTKGFGAAAKALKMTKVVNGAVQLSEKGKLFQTLGTTIANIIGEAALEGYDNLKTSREVIANRDYNLAYDMLTPEQKQEVNQRVGPYAANVFNANAAMLLIPNLIQARFFIGPVKSSSQKIIKAVKTGKFKTEDISVLRNTLKNGAIGVVSEGLWEEGMQQAVQNYEKSKAEGKAFLNRIPGYGYEWVNNWYDIEGQQSMLIGAMIGAGMGAPRGVIDAIQEKAVGTAFQNRYNALLNGTMAVADEAMINFKHPYRLFDSVIKDKDGNEKKIKTIINPATGKAEVDNNKFIKMLQADAFNKEVTENLLMAALNNDEIQEKFFINQALQNFFYKYASDNIFETSDEALEFMLKQSKLDEMAQDPDLKALGYDFDYMSGKLRQMKSEWDMLNQKINSIDDINNDTDEYRTFRQKVDKAALYNRLKLLWLDEVAGNIKDQDQVNTIREDANNALSILEDRTERKKLYEEYLKTRDVTTDLQQKYDAAVKEDANSVTSKMYKHLLDEEEKIYGSKRMHDVLTITERPIDRTGILGLKNQHYFNLAADAIVGMRLESAMQEAVSPAGKADLLDIVNILTAPIDTTVESTGKLDISQSDIDAIDAIIPKLREKLESERNTIEQINKRLTKAADEEFAETNNSDVYTNVQRDVDANIGSIDARLRRFDEGLKKLGELRSQIVDLPQGKGLLNYRDNVSKLEKDDDIFLRNVAEIPIQETKDAIAIANNTTDYANYPKLRELLDKLLEQKELYEKTDLKERLNRKAFKGYMEMLEKAIASLSDDFMNAVRDRYNYDKNADQTNQKSANKRKFKALGIDIEATENNGIVDQELFERISDIVGASVVNGILQKAKDAGDIDSEYLYHEIFADKIIALLKEKLALNKDLRSSFDAFIKDKFSRSIDDFEIAYTPFTSEVTGRRYLDRHRAKPKKMFYTMLTNIIGAPDPDYTERSATDKYLLNHDILQYYEGLRSETNTGYPDLNKAAIVNLVAKEITVQAFEELIDTVNSDFNINEHIEKEKEIYAELKIGLTNQQIHAERQIASWWKKKLDPINYGEKDQAKRESTYYKNWAFVKGNAGTGKTQVLINILLRTIGIKPSEVQFIAPHQMASDMLKDQSLSTNDPILEKDFETVPDSAKVIVIDEIAAFTDSQLSIMAEKIFNINKQRNSEKKETLKVIVLGDPSQVQVNQDETLVSHQPAINEVTKTGIEYIYLSDPLTIKFRSIITEINEFLEIFEGSKKDVRGITVYSSADTARIGGVAIGVQSGDMGHMMNMIERHKSTKRSRIVVVADNRQKEEFIAKHPELRDVVYRYDEIAGIERDEVYIAFSKDDFKYRNDIRIQDYNSALYTAASRAKQYIFVNNNLNDFGNAVRMDMYDKFFGDKTKGYHKIYNDAIQERKEAYERRLEAESTILNDGVIKQKVKKDNVTKEPIKQQNDFKDKDIDDLYQDMEEDDSGESEEDSSESVKEIAISIPALKGKFTHKVAYSSGAGLNYLKTPKTEQKTLKPRLTKDSPVIYFITANQYDKSSPYTIHILGQLYKADGTLMDEYAHLGIVSNAELDGELSFLKKEADSRNKYGSITDWRKGVTSIRKKATKDDHVLAYGKLKIAKPLEYKYSATKKMSGKGWLTKLIDIVRVRLNRATNEGLTLNIRIFTQKELADPKYSSIADKKLSAGMPYLIINRKTKTGEAATTQFVRLDPSGLPFDHETVVKLKPFVESLRKVIAITGKYDNGTLGDKQFNSLIHWFARSYKFEGDVIKKQYDRPYEDYAKQELKYRLNLTREEYNNIASLIDPIIKGYYGKGSVRKTVASEAAMREAGYKDEGTIKYTFVKNKNAEDGSGYIVVTDSADPEARKRYEREDSLVAGAGEAQKALNLIAKANSTINGKTIRTERLKFRNTAGDKAEGRYVITAKSMFSTSDNNVGYYDALRRLLSENNISMLKDSYTDPETGEVNEVYDSPWITEKNVLAAEYYLMQEGILDEEKKEKLFQEHHRDPITLDQLDEIVNISNKTKKHKTLRMPLPMYEINRLGNDVLGNIDELESMLQTSLTDIIEGELSIEIDDVIERRKEVKTDKIEEDQERKERLAKLDDEMGNELEGSSISKRVEKGEEPGKDKPKLFTDSELNTIDKGPNVSQRRIIREIRRSIPGIKDVEVKFLLKHQIDALAERPAWGLFKDGVLYLVKNTDETVYRNVARHEVFHKIWNEYFTESEREKIRSLVEKEFPDYKSFVRDLTEDYIIEEFLARKYQEWNNGLLKTIGNEIRSFFERILRLLKIYVDHTNTIEDIFFGVKYGSFVTRHSIADNTTRLMKDILSKFDDMETYLYCLDRVMKDLREYRLYGVKKISGLVLTNSEISKRLLIDYKERIKENEKKTSLKARVNNAVLNLIVKYYEDIKNDIYPRFNTFAGGEYISELTEDAKQEIYENKAGDNLSRQIIDNEYHNTENDISHEVKELLSYVAIYKPDKTTIDHLLSWRYVYVKALAMFGNMPLDQDTSNDLNVLKKMIDESMRSKNLTAAEQAILAYFKDDVIGNVINRVTEDGHLITNEGKYITSDVFVYKKGGDVTDIKHIHDRRIDNDKVLTIVKRPGEEETSIEFADRIMDQTGLSIDQIGALSKQQYYNNIWNKFVNHFNSHRQRDPRIGERKIHYGSYKIRYIFARGNAVVNGIRDNLANIIGNKIPDQKAFINIQNQIRQWSKDFEGNNLDFVKAFLSYIGLPEYNSDLRDYNAALIVQDIKSVFSDGGNIGRRFGEDYIPQIEKTNDKDEALAEAEAGLVNELTVEDILENQETSFLNDLTDAIALVDNLSRVLASNDAKNNRRFNAVLSSQGHRNIFNLINSKNGIEGMNSVKRMDKYKKPFFKNNIFINGINKIYRLIDDDGFKYDSVYGNEYPVQYRNEKREDHNFRTFVLAFLNDVSHSKKNNPTYTQFITPNERKTPFGVVVNVLKREQLLDSIKASINQIYDKIEHYDKSSKNYKGERNFFLGFDILPKVLGNRTVIRNKKDLTNSKAEIKAGTKTKSDYVSVEGLAIEIYNALNERSKELTQSIIYDRMPFDTNLPNESKLDEIVDRVLYEDYTVGNIPSVETSYGGKTVKHLKLTQTWKEFEEENEEKDIDRSTAFDRGDEKRYMIEPEHIQALVSSYYINNYVNSYHFSQLVAGDHSSFKDVKDYVKRLSIAFAPGKNGYVHDKYGMNKYSRTAVISDPVNTKEELRNFFKAIVGDDLSNSDLEEILKAYPEDFKPADSQGFMLPERMDDINYGFGEKFGNVLKGVYYHIEDDGNATAFKYSQIVLSNDICERGKDENGDPILTPLGKLRKKMRENKDTQGNPAPIDEVIFDSGVKTGKPSRQNTWSDLIDTDSGFIPESIITVDNSDYRVQFNPESTLEAKVSLPTQLSYIMNLYGVNDTIADNIYSSLAAIFKNNFEDLQSWMTPKSLKEVITEFLKHVKQDNVANLISEGVDINFPGIVDNVLTHYLSSIFDRTIKTKFTGKDLILQTAVGSHKIFEEEGVTLSEDMKREPQIKRDENGRFYAEAFVPRDMVPDDVARRIDEALSKGKIPEDFFFYKPANKEEIKTTDLFGFRIPSSEMHSGIPIKIVGFYDSRKTNVIVAPRLLVALHGSDFDIDSLFTVQRKTVPTYEGSNGRPIGYEYDEKTGRYVFQANPKWLEDELKKTEGLPDRDRLNRLITEAYHLNNVAENFILALTSRQNIDRMITPIYIGELHNEAAHINKIKGTSERTLDPSDALDVQAIHDTVFTGDNAIGLFMNLFKGFALMHRAYKEKTGDKSQKIHDVTKLKKDYVAVWDDEQGIYINKIRFNNTNYTDLVDYTEKSDLGDSNIQTGVRFDSLANAALDNLKEFVLPQLNVGRETIRAYAVMVMHGIKFRTINYFIGQPILQYSTKFGKRDASILEKRLKTIFDGAELSTAQIELEDISMQNYLKKSPEYIKELAGKEKLTKKERDFLQYQLAVLNQFKTLDKLGEELSKVASLANIIRNWPVKVDELEEIIEKAKHILGIPRDKRISNVTADDTNSAFPYYMNNFLNVNQHIRSALISMEWVVGIVNKNFITYGSKFREISDIVLENTKIKFEISNAKTKKKIREEFVKFLMTSLIDLSDEQPAEFTTWRKEKKGKDLKPKNVMLYGPAAFNKRFIEYVRDAKRFDLMLSNASKGTDRPYDGNMFLKSISIKKQWWNGRETLKFNGPSMMDNKDHNLYRNSFQQLWRMDFNKNEKGEIVKDNRTDSIFSEVTPGGYTEFQKMFVKYAFLNYGMSFGLRNYSKVLPGDLYKDLSDQLIQLLHKVETLNSDELRYLAEAFEAQLVQVFPEAITGNMIRPNNRTLKKVYTVDKDTDEKDYSGVVDTKAEPDINSKYNGLHFDRHFINEIPRDWPRFHIEKYGQDIVIFRRVSDKNDKHAFYVRIGHKNDDGTYYLKSFADAITYNGDALFERIAQSGIKLLKGSLFRDIYENKYDKLGVGEAVYISEHNDPGAIYGKYYKVKQVTSENRYKLEESKGISNDKLRERYKEDSPFVDRVYNEIMKRLSLKEAPTRKFAGRIYVLKHGYNEAIKYVIKLNEEYANGKQIVRIIKNQSGQLQIIIDKKALGEHLLGRQLTFYANGITIADEAEEFLTEFMNIKDVEDLKKNITLVDEGVLDVLYDYRIKYEGRDAVDILDDIIKRGTPFQKMMAQRMRPYIEKNLPNIVSRRIDKREGNKITIAQFNADGTISVDYLAHAITRRKQSEGERIKDLDTIILHEFVHAISMLQMFEDKEFREQIKEWMNYVKENHPEIVEQNKYAFSDPDGYEFLEEFWTDENLYNSLRDVSTPGNKKSIVKRILEWLFGWLNKGSKTNLAYSIDKYIEDNLKPVPYYEKITDKLYRNNRGQLVEIEEKNYSHTMYSKSKWINKIIEQGIDWSIILDEHGEQTDKYRNGAGTKLLGRVSDIRTGLTSFFRKESKNTTFGERQADREWRYTSKEEKRNVDGKLMSYDEYKISQDEKWLKTAIRGRVLHLINNMVVDKLYNGGFNEAKIKAQIQDICYKTYYLKDSTGKEYEIHIEEDPDKYLWFERRSKEIWETYGVNAQSDISDEIKDIVASEVTVASEILGHAGTADMVVEHHDGSVSLFDIATGFNFNDRLSSRILRYGDQNISIMDSPKELKKLQLMLYAIMMKANNPNLKFRGLSILWAPNEYWSQSRDKTLKVEVADYLEMIKSFLKDKKLLKELGMNENAYSELIAASPSIFNAEEYSYEYNAKKIGKGEPGTRTIADTIDDIESSNKEPWRKAELYLAEMQRIIGKAPVIIDIGKSKYEHLNKEDQKLLKELSERVLQIFRDPEVVLNVSDKYDVSLLTSMLGNYSDISDPRVQTWKKLRDYFSLQMYNEIDTKMNKYRSLHRAVVDEYYRKHPLPIRNKKWMNFINYKKMYAFMYKEFDNNGSTQLRLKHRDLDKDEFGLNGNLTQAQQNYLDYLNETYRSYFEGENALGNQISTYVPEKGEMVPIKNIDLYNKELSENDKFRYYPGWFPKVQKEIEEVIYDEGQGSYVKGLINMKFIKDMLHRSLTYYIENRYQGRTHSAMVLPFKYLGSFNIDNTREYTYSGELQFDRFINSMEYKKHMDGVYASGEAVRMTLDMERDKGQPMYANTVTMLERKLTSDILGRTIRPKLTRKALKPFGTKWEDRELRTDAILMLMKNWTSATLMWLKPFTGGGNGLHASLLQHRDALKSTISARIFGVEQDAIDFTLKDQLWADGEYFNSFLWDAAKGQLDRNKIWLLVRKLRYMPDNFDYRSADRYLLSLSNRLISENTMYAPHKIPEEFVSIITMLAQLKHLKHPTTGKSIYDCYKVVDKGNGEYDVEWDKEVPSRGKLKHGSADRVWYEDMTELTSHEVAKLKKVYERLQGGYRKEEASALEVYVVGKMFMQFKKYYPRLLINAFSSSRKEDDLGYMKKLGEKQQGEDVYTWMQRMNEGRFKILGKWAATLINRNAFERQYRWSEMPPLYKQHVVDAGLSFGMYAMLYTAYLMMFGDDDDNDSLKKWYKMYLLDNFIQQYDPRELAKIGVQSLQPVAFTRSLDAMTGFATMMGAAWDYAIGDKEEAFTQKGDFRGWNQVKKTLPLFASYYDFIKRVEESSDISRILQWDAKNKWR